MAELNDRPFPPGNYPVVVVGTGPGGLQTSYSLRALGIEHALLSADDAPGGMFRRFPLFQRLITWTKPYAPVPRDGDAYEWYDWNSLLADEPEHRNLVPGLMKPTSYFPSRAEMEAGLVTFAHRTGLRARYRCRWTGTRLVDDGVVLETSDGEYSCSAVVFAIGMTQPWKPPIPGLDDVRHYAEITDTDDFTGKRVFIIGKRNSGFEIADGLLPVARQLIVASPRPARLSLFIHSTAGARARYAQPYEDHILGGGHFVLDAAIEDVRRTAEGWRVHASGTTHPGALTLDVDEVIAATGFTTPLGDLPSLGVRTFNQNRLPVQTAHWESSDVGRIFFAGSVTQGAIGLKKYGIPSNSAAVHGFRYNARLLARHIAERFFGVAPARRPLSREQVVPFLLERVQRSGALRNQQSYLAHVVTFDRDGPGDEGVHPLTSFLDGSGPDGIAAVVETDAAGDIHPAIYIRRSNNVEERTLGAEPFLTFDTEANAGELAAALKGLID